MKEYFKGRFFVVLIFIAAFLLGFMVNILLDNGNSPPEHLIGIVVTPVQSFFTSIKNNVSNFFETFENYEDLNTENKELKAKITKLEDELDESYHLQEENKRLKALSGIKENNQKFEFIAADIVAVPTNGWNSTFSINKGSLSGINKKSVVVSGDGLVGYVKDVGLNWAKVVTIIDPQVAVGAVVSRTGDMAMTEGTVELKAEGFCKLAYIDNTVLINRGDIVRTSGLGGLYPEGLRIGEISSIVVEDHGLTQYAVITPFVDFSSLKEVYIILNFDVDEEK